MNWLSSLTKTKLCWLHTHSLSVCAQALCERVRRLNGSFFLLLFFCSRWKVKSLLWSAILRWCNFGCVAWRQKMLACWLTWFAGLRYYLSQLQFCGLECDLVTWNILWISPFLFQQLRFHSDSLSLSLPRIKLKSLKIHKGPTKCVDRWRWRWHQRPLFPHHFWSDLHTSLRTTITRSV